MEGWKNDALTVSWDF